MTSTQTGPDPVNDEFKLSRRDKFQVLIVKKENRLGLIGSDSNPVNGRTIRCCLQERLAAGAEATCAGCGEESADLWFSETNDVWLHQFISGSVKSRCFIGITGFVLFLS